MTERTVYEDSDRRVISEDGVLRSERKSYVGSLNELVQLAEPGLIRLPSGALVVEETIDIVHTAENPAPALSFLGAGANRTTLRRAGNFPLLRFAGVEGTTGGPGMASDLAMEGVTLDGDGHAANLVELLECNHVHMTNVRMFDVAGRAIYGRCVSNSHFNQCRFSRLSDGATAAVHLVNGANLDTNGVRFNGCDWEVNASGRDLHVAGDTTRKIVDITLFDCKFESTPNEPFAPDQRAFFERAENLNLLYVDMIRGLGPQLDFSLCGVVNIEGGRFINGRGDYLLWFRDGGPYKVRGTHLQGSSAPGRKNLAHVGIGASAEVHDLGGITHVVRQDEVPLIGAYA